MKDKPSSNTTLQHTEEKMVFTAVHDANKITKDCIWIGDTGASTHMSNNREGFYELEKISSKTKFAKEDDGTDVTEMGKWRGRHYVYAEQEKQLVRENIITMNDVLYIPCLRNNLYSITKGITIIIEVPSCIRIDGCVHIVAIITV